MNRRQKIIVSVVGIFIVLLALVGLTYGYFLTRIQGNTNTNSISVTTANLELTYGDGTTEILTKSGLLPGEVAGTKDFTVTNNGDTSEYVVYIDEVTVTDATTNVVTEFESNDFVYELTCTKSDGTECVGVEKGVFPMNNGILIGNRIESGDVHTYQFKLTYLETNENQTDDMNKTLSAKINIGDIKQHNTEDNPDIESVMNPYEEGTLAYTIINNAKNVTEAQIEDGYAELLATPKTKVAVESSKKIFKSEAVEGTDEVFELDSTYQNSYWTYGSDYKIDEETGLVSLAGTIEKCKYNSEGCTEQLIGKYVIMDDWGDEFITDTDTFAITENLPWLYKIVTAPTSSDGAVVEAQVRFMNQQISSLENVLSVTNDDYGLSYYYRGGVKNNYLNFNNMCWRIVRIEGDGSIRLILEDKEAVCSSDTLAKRNTSFIGKADYGGGFGTNDINDSHKFNYDSTTGATKTIKTLLNTFLNGGKYTWNVSNRYEYEAFSEDNINKLKAVSQCIGDSTTVFDKSGNILSNTIQDQTYYYKMASRLFGYGVEKSASMICDSESNRTLDNNIFILTADEIVYAGEVASDSTDFNVSSSYLFDNVESLNLDDDWHTVTLMSNQNSESVLHDSTVFVTSYYSVLQGNYSSGKNVRPAISLKPGRSYVSGNGTVTSPYEIN